MMKRVYLCVVAILIMIICPNQMEASGYDGMTISFKEMRVQEDHVGGLTSLIAQINSFLPLSIDLGILELKTVRKERDNIIFYVLVDENIRGDWGRSFDPKTEAKYMIAEMIAFPEIINHLLKTDKEELDLMRKEGDRRSKAIDHPQCYKKIKLLLDTARNNRVGVNFNLHSRDGYNKTIHLNSEDVTDAVIFYKEIIDNYQKKRMVR